MTPLTLQNPAFVTYLIAASLMILKAVCMSWLTVAQMMRVRGGWRSPEDLRQTLLNPTPDPKQLLPDESVERIRRIHMNDLENIPFFLASGALFLFTDPSLAVTQGLMYGYVLTRALHFVAYLTAQTHDVRAAMWTPGSLILLYMGGASLWCGVQGL